MFIQVIIKLYIVTIYRQSNSNAHMNRDPRCITKLKRKRISTSGGNSISALALSWELD
ncbi:hypothetical protein TorRG33x02_075180 [Trema orientale]|uniref:Uncharacterized protein n=1 Tax=Trema orientale TaxID=63057 RepID=A0A2P5FGA6_TREOI|nr:hypothetical protein TorRG33x02_075180 [Trema orientale]